MKYRVHIYAVCRRLVEVEADSQEHAVCQANEMDMEELFNTHGWLSDGEQNPEYADEVQDFLVDEVGDTEYKNTNRWVILPDGQTPYCMSEAEKGVKT